jgi:hypothetical protein
MILDQKDMYIFIYFWWHVYFKNGACVVHETLIRETYLRASKNVIEN